MIFAWYLHFKFDTCQFKGWIDADNFSRLDFKIRGDLVQHPVTSDYYLMLIAYTELSGQAWFLREIQIIE